MIDISTRIISIVCPRRNRKVIDLIETRLTTPIISEIKKKRRYLVQTNIQTEISSYRVDVH